MSSPGDALAQLAAKERSLSAGKATPKTKLPQIPDWAYERLEIESEALEALMDVDEKLRKRIAELEAELAKRPHDYNDAMCCYEADQKILRLEALAKERHDAAHAFLERAEKAEAEVERLRDSIFQHDRIHPNCVRLFDPETMERGGREETDTSGEASPTRVASPPPGKHRCEDADETWMPDHTAPSGVSPSPPLHLRDRRKRGYVPPARKEASP